MRAGGEPTGSSEDVSDDLELGIGIEGMSLDGVREWAGSSGIDGSLDVLDMASS